MRLIDADALSVHNAYCVDEAGWGANFYVVDKSDIDNAPTIDAVPVVRCAECKWFDKGGNGVAPICAKHSGLAGAHDLSFCSYGERRSDE